MKRSQRANVAQQTVDIVKRRGYETASGRAVDLRASVDACLAGTRLLEPEQLEQLRAEQVALVGEKFETTIELRNETTLSGLTRLLAEGSDPVAALNFASAKNPGGGFLGGSQAQEESLARSSALYASLQKCWDFYERHRALSSMLYTDAMIWSPNCPIFRNDDGVLLDEPQLASFITSPAPNAGAAADNRPEELPLIPEVFRRRSEYVLALAAAQGHRRLVLGAWGCGVFRNDPTVVATAFAEHLRRAWAGRFERVVFSVLDTSPGQETFKAFERALG
jgi:uncharacterized protein (TIGR02452 family)